MSIRAFVLAFLLLPAIHAESWKLIWGDEFDGKAHQPPDAAKWTYDLGSGGWGNGELETYTKDAKNVFLDGRGHLVICARKDRSGRYTSARLKTEGKFAVQYGRIAVRMKIPRGQGVWPAFWMLGADIEKNGWPSCGEIDVMENIGREPATVHGTIHGPGYSGAKSIGRPYTPPGSKPLPGDFHVYEAQWAPDSITFRLDDHAYFTVTPRHLPPGARWVYDHPFFLLLNLAIGGHWPGNPDRTTHFPQKLIVDWVRVWQQSP